MYPKVLQGAWRRRVDLQRQKNRHLIEIQLFCFWLAILMAFQTKNTQAIATTAILDSFTDSETSTTLTTTTTTTIRETMENSTFAYSTNDWISDNITNIQINMMTFEYITYHVPALANVELSLYLRYIYKNPIKWYKDGKLLITTNKTNTQKSYVISNDTKGIQLDEKTSALILKAVTAKDTGLYSYYIVDEFQNLPWTNLTLIVDDPSFVYDVAFFKKFEDEIGSPLTAPEFYEDNKSKTDLPILVGELLTINCNAYGIPNPNTTWYFNNTKVDLKFENAYELKKNIIREDNSGIYKCVVCNFFGCIKRETNLLVSGEPHIIEMSKNLTAIQNENVTLKCELNSDFKTAIVWYKLLHSNFNNWQDIVRSKNRSQSHRLSNNGDRPQIFVLNSVQRRDAGWYVCYAENKCGEDMARVYLNVIDDTTKVTWTIYVLVVGVFLFQLSSLSLVYVVCKRRFTTVHQWKKKVIIIYQPVLGNDNAHDLQMPVIKIEKQRTKIQTSSNVDSAQGFDEYEFPLDSEWELPRSQLTLGETLGEGAFGRVVRAETCGLICTAAVNNSSSIVAAKMVKEDHTDADIESLVHEMEVMKIIGKHLNIINLLGCCSQNGPLWVIVEFAPHGNLKDFLKKNCPTSTKHSYQNLSDDSSEERKLNLTEKELISFAFQIARGMEYLASKKCIHRDLAARNVLVSDDYVMKIADFGLARDIHDTDYYRKKTNGLLPIKWMAPESLTEKFYNSQSDVWSFGVLLWEIMTYGDQPYSNITSVEELYKYLITGQRLEKPDSCSLVMYELMRQCWRFDPANRPTFNELSKNLNEFSLLTSNSINNDEYFDSSMPLLERQPSSNVDGLNVKKVVFAEVH